ncbi:MAG: hypothetical protein QXP42_02280 [Candidatus Micrarchaeia archaeon]
MEGETKKDKGENFFLTPLVSHESTDREKKIMAIFKELREAGIPIPYIFNTPSEEHKFRTLAEVYKEYNFSKSEISEIYTALSGLNEPYPDMDIREFLDTVSSHMGVILEGRKACMEHFKKEIDKLDNASKLVQDEDFEKAKKQLEKEEFICLAACMLPKDLINKLILKAKPKKTRNP